MCKETEAYKIKHICFPLLARRPIASAVRPFLSRRGTAATTGGSFKRRSLKLRRNTKDGKDMEADCKLIQYYKLKNNFLTF